MSTAHEFPNMNKRVIILIGRSGITQAIIGGTKPLQHAKIVSLIDYIHRFNI